LCVCVCLCIKIDISAGRRRKRSIVLQPRAYAFFFCESPSTCWSRLFSIWIKMYSKSSVCLKILLCALHMRTHAGCMCYGRWSDCAGTAAESSHTDARQQHRRRNRSTLCDQHPRTHSTSECTGSAVEHLIRVPMPNYNNEKPKSETEASFYLESHKVHSQRISTRKFLERVSYYIKLNQVSFYLQ
jgi:hypothetical protein